MMTLIRCVLAAAVALCTMAAWAAPGDAEFDRGYELFVAGDYQGASKLWKAAAEKGHPRAQNGLGVLYRDGDLGESDKKQAAYWFRQSAENGYAFAMYSLGLLLRDGDGVMRDDIEAHKWFDLASALNFDPKAQFQRDLISRRMSREAIAEARRRAQEWLNRFFFGGVAA
jgi:TPR repeat protein